MIKRVKTLAELNKVARQILFKELGVVNTIRFLSQFEMGSGTYATDRDAWERELTVHDIVADIERRKRRKVTRKLKAAGRPGRIKGPKK